MIARSPSWRGLAARLAIGLLCLLILCACHNASEDDGLPSLTPAVSPTPSATAHVASVAPKGAATPDEPPAATPCPTSTPFSEEALGGALRDLARRGEYAAAITLAMQAKAPASTLGPEAMAALAQAYANEQRGADAVAVLEALLDAYPDWSAAWGALGDQHLALGQSSLAIDAYRHFAEMAPEVAPYARFKAAMLLRDLGDHAGVIAELSAADLSSLPASRRAEVLELLAQSYLEQGAYDDALATYDAILAFSQFADYRALLTYYQALVHLEAGRTDDAMSMLRSVAHDRPQAYAAFLALERLIELGDGELSPIEQARIFYYARAYGRAAQAADDALALGDDVAAALFWKGQAYAALGRYAEALALFDEIIEDHASDEVAGDAWMAKAAVAEALGGDPAGIYHEFVRLYPDHVRAPEALWRAAVSWEQRGRWGLAREYYQRLVVEYSVDSRVAEARFRAALAAYAMGAWAEAAEGWAAALESDPPSEKPRVQLWLGLARDRLGDEDAAREAWDAASRALPWGYYGLRAHELRDGREANEASTATPPVPLDAARWATLRAWAEGWWQPSEGSPAIDVADHPLSCSGPLAGARGPARRSI